MQTNQDFQFGTYETNPQQPVPGSCFSLIWLRGIDQYNEAGILINTLETTGVISARYTCRSPYILLVNYNAGITNAMNILRGTQCNVADAKIVGC